MNRQQPFHSPIFHFPHLILSDLSALSGYHHHLGIIVTYIDAEKAESGIWKNNFQSDLSPDSKRSYGNILITNTLNKPSPLLHQLLGTEESTEI